MYIIAHLNRKLLAYFKIKWVCRCQFIPNAANWLIIIFLPAKLYAIFVICVYFIQLCSQIYETGAICAYKYRMTITNKSLKYDFPWQTSIKLGQLLSILFLTLLETVSGAWEMLSRCSKWHDMLKPTFYGEYCMLFTLSLYQDMTKWWHHNLMECIEWLGWIYLVQAKHWKMIIYALIFNVYCMSELNVNSEKMNKGNNHIHLSVSRGGRGVYDVNVDFTINLIWYIGLSCSTGSNHSYYNGVVFRVCDMIKVSLRAVQTSVD